MKVRGYLKTLFMNFLAETLKFAAEVKCSLKKIIPLTTRLLSRCDILAYSLPMMPFGDRKLHPLKVLTVLGGKRPESHSVVVNKAKIILISVKIVKNIAKVVITMIYPCMMHFTR